MYEKFLEAISCFFTAGLNRFYSNVLAFEGQLQDVHSGSYLRKEIRAQVNVNVL